MSDATTVWAAVDKLTNPTRQRLHRAGNEWLDELATPTDGACSVPAYRAATTHHAEIPSLWDQSTMALYGAEIAPGRGSKPLRERSLADLDLMEIRALIRDTARDHLEAWGEPVERRDYPTAFDGTHIRHFASLALTKTSNPTRCSICRSTEDIPWWTYRFEQWGRLLETYLRAVEVQGRPIRLRNSPCPDCGTRQVTVNQEGQVTQERDPDNMVVPALVIDFRDGYVRAASCSMCGSAWFRGPDLEQLAEVLGVGFKQHTEQAC